MTSTWKLYKIKNRVTGEETEIGAYSAEEACWKLGWFRSDCDVRKLGEQPAMEL